MTINFLPHTGLADIINLGILMEYCSNETLRAYGFVEKMSLFQEIAEHGIFRGITAYGQH
jgi:hypothetical protein